MKVYTKLRSSVQPQSVQITPNSVIVASDIQAYEEVIDGHTLAGFEYKGTEYTKDEYMLLQDQKITSLEQELAAAKILLGVD